jgi:hypothetical protein
MVFCCVLETPTKGEDERGCETDRESRREWMDGWYVEEGEGRRRSKRKARIGSRRRVPKSSLSPQSVHPANDNGTAEC